MFISSFYCDIKRRNEPKKKNTLFVRESNDFAWNFLKLFYEKWKKILAQNRTLSMPKLGQVGSSRPPETPY